MATYAKLQQARTQWQQMKLRVLQVLFEVLMCIIKIDLFVRYHTHTQQHKWLCQHVLWMVDPNSSD